MPVYYKITDGTHIRKTPMKKLLAHVKTKAELTEYLASKTLEKGRQSGKCVVMAWSCRCEATHMDASHLASNHEQIQVIASCCGRYDLRGNQHRDNVTRH